MAHEVENMMYVGEKPWHGLGVELKDPPTTEEAIRLSGLDWSVRTDPVYRMVADSDQQPTSEFEEVNAQVVIRESDNTVLGIVGPTYTPLQNIEAFDWFQAFLDSGLASIETAGSLRDGQRVWIMAKILAPNSVIVDGDEIEKKLLLVNGHDGKLAARAGFSPTRVVCANTLEWALQDERSSLIKVRHTAKIKENIDELREVMNLVNQQFEAGAEQYRLLERDISITDLEKYIKVVFKLQPKKNQVIDSSTVTVGEDEMKRTMGKIIPLFESGRGSDIKGVRGTWWGAYNAISEHLTWERGKSQDNRINNLWFDQGRRLNKTALVTALKMSA